MATNPRSHGHAANTDNKRLASEILEMPLKPRAIRRFDCLATAIAAVALLGACSNAATGATDTAATDTAATDTAATDTGGGGADVADTTGVDSVSGDGVATDGIATDSVGNDVASSDSATADAAVTDADEDGADGGVDATPGDIAAADVIVAPDIDESKGLASSELLVKILGPSGRDWIQADSQMAQISGVTFGAAESLSWTSSSGKTGTIDLAAYWVSGIIELVEGDNTIKISAKAGAVTVTDAIHIVYNPFFSFEGAPAISPDLLFVGESSKIVVRMPLSAAGTGPAGKGPVDPSTVKLIEVDQAGKLIKEHMQLVDNGQSGSCDDIQKDGYFSGCLTISPTVAKRMYFRVSADVAIFNKKYTALSPIAVVDAAERFSQSECSAIVGLQSKVKSDALAAIASGTDRKVAAADAVTALKADATVAEAGVSPAGFAVWVRYKTGRFGGLNLAPPGYRAGGGVPGAGYTSALPTHSVGTRRGLLIAPAAAEFQTGKPAGDGDEAVYASEALKARECPPFQVDDAVGNDALLYWYRNIWQYGLIAMTGHGDVLFNGMDPAAAAATNWEHTGAQEVMWSGEKVVCSNIAASSKSCSSDASCSAGQECVKTSAKSGVCVDYTQGDIMAGRVVIGADTYGILPAFFQRHMRQDMPGSIVYLGACRTLWNGSIAVQLVGAGAAAVVGYSNYITNDFGWERGKAFFKAIIDESDSVLHAVDTTTLDPVTYARMRWIGNPKANAKDANLINAGWDSGKATGWKAVGDGRVISRLGFTVPVAGKFMGIISTGLGFTDQNGSLEQAFCVQPGASKICYYWKFYSEEFIEYCGSSYMDRFTVTLTGKQGKLTMTDVWIDPLCPYDCGGKSSCQPGSPSCKCGSQWKTLDPADIIFDQGGVYMTPWQKECKDVTPFAGKRVDLKFFATDKGDSIFDTAVLVDEVTIE